MATFTLVQGTNVGPSPRANGPASEAASAQRVVNSTMNLSQYGQTWTWVYDDSAHTLTLTFSGTAA